MPKPEKLLLRTRACKMRYQAQQHRPCARDVIILLINIIIHVPLLTHTQLSTSKARVAHLELQQRRLLAALKLRSGAAAAFQPHQPDKSKHGTSHRHEYSRPSTKHTQSRSTPTCIQPVATVVPDTAGRFLAPPLVEGRMFC